MGSQENISLFRTLGFDLIPIESENQALEKLEELFDSGNYALIMITDRWEKKLGNKINDFKYRPFPALCSIPIRKDSEKEYLADVVERAIGSDIDVE